MCFPLFRVSKKYWLAPLTAVTPREDTLIGGKYPVRAGQTIGVPALCVHRDPEVWGEDVCA